MCSLERNLRGIMPEDLRYNWGGAGLSQPEPEEKPRVRHARLSLFLKAAQSGTRAYYGAEADEGLGCRNGGLGRRLS